MKTTTFSSYKKELLKNPDFNDAYNELEPQYEVIKALIKYRIENNITQQELSDRTGISKSNISRFESGKHSPTLNMLHRIANGLKKEVKLTLIDS